MSCCGQRENLGEAREEQKWDYIVSNTYPCPLTPLMLNFTEHI